MVENLMNVQQSICPKRSSKLLTAMIALVVLALILPGCSTVKRTSHGVTRGVVMKFKTEDRGLKRFIALMPIENFTQLTSTDETQQFRQQLVTRLGERCRDLVLLHPEEAQFPQGINPPPSLSSGAIDNLGLAANARKEGVFGIAFIRITGVFTDERFAGILWWRDPQTVLQVQLVADLYGAQPGAKLLSESYTQELDIDPDIARLMYTQQEQAAPVILDALARIAAELEEDICDGIMKRPWQGFVTRIDQDRIHISSGSNAGLEVGDRFEVFPQGKVITGLGGERFWLPGPKAGRIELVTVEPQSSEAITFPDTQIPLNSTIQTP